MSRWFRVYDDLVDDPKVQRLSPELFKSLINLWCLASRNGGALPPLADIAFSLRVKLEKVSKVIGELRAAGLFDPDGTGLRPHNWEGRQFKADVTDPTGAARQKRWRNRHRNGDSVTEAVTKTVTSPVTIKRPDTETEKKDAADAASTGSEEVQLFMRGKAVLGVNAGGLIKNLLKAKGSVPLARAAIETASTKQSPREYIGAVIRGGQEPESRVII